MAEPWTSPIAAHHLAAIQVRGTIKESSIAIACGSEFCCRPNRYCLSHAHNRVPTRDVCVL